MKGFSFIEVVSQCPTAYGRRAGFKNVGEKLYANIVMLGALVKITEMVNEESMEKAISYAFPEKFVSINMEAYKKGKELACVEEVDLL
jgi:Pyruvate/2-oxoacid:ferredoxin oxidoreductase gamma subunit